MEGTKVCTKCKMEKSLIEFYKERCTKSGYRVSCKMCHNIEVKELTQKYSRPETRDVKYKKVCWCCKKEKTVIEYGKNRFRKDGFDGE